MLIKKQKILDFIMVIEIYKHKISGVENVKYWGVLLDDQLSWHVAHVKKQISKAYGILSMFIWLFIH